MGFEVMKDQFGTEINVQDRVIFNNQDCTGSFMNYAKGTIVDIKKEWLMIKPDDGKQLVWWLRDKNTIRRRPHRVIVITNNM